MTRTKTAASSIRSAAMILGITALLSACDGKSDAQLAAETTASGATAALVQDRFRTYESELGPQETLAKLLTALDRRDLSVFAVIDHAANAQSVGLELDASTVVIFGNPNGGTPLIRAEPLMGAELPLRALVYQRGDKTFVAVTGVGFLERSYGLSERAPVIDKIRDALNAIATEATTS